MSQEMTVKSLKALNENHYFLKAYHNDFGSVPHGIMHGIMHDDLATNLDQAHESVSAFAQAYSLGEKESAAAVNLLQNIPQPIKESLTELVRTLGITKSYCCLNIVIKSGII